MHEVIQGDPAQRWKCWLLTHRYVRIRYPGSDSPDGYYLRCTRCNNEREASGGWGYSGGMDAGS